MAQMTKSSIDGLPKHFVSAMRTLFDIMDDQKTGYVNYSDIEVRWRDDGSSGLPKGVLDGLKKVTPPNGLLSFERFCAGLKICLLHAQAESESKKLESGSSQPPNRPPSAPVLDNQSKTVWTSPNTAAIRPNNVISQQRTLSMPQLPGRKEGNAPFDVEARICPAESKLMKVYGPPKPPRTGAALDSRVLNADRSFDKSEIRTALQNWQMGLMMGADKAISDKRQLVGPKYRVDPNALLHPARVLGDGKSIDIQSAQQLALQTQSKKSPNRHREPRRHTLQNGIDYNMMKRMKQIEQEKDVLLQGLAAVEKARDWYLKQISITQEKIKHLGRMGSHVEQWTEAQQERLELQRARVVEVNRHLAALISSWERGGLPLHMNLAFLSTQSSAQLQQDTLSRLKQQNHRLTEEVSKKSHRIALLEQEKDGLVRELYDRQTGIVQSRRSTMIHEQHDQTFM
ncbi:PREDICTED: suppressor APC domain-containing protein 2 isoform X2 [Ceratosolen solmsi marchali]|uniref:Suppressor APC domain-containing protein 2 isoform X2 n=1 Tax=Ceratosolen solmsi marchali TaxID=326594 RepID=A0AAJ7DWN3_9HYME|nr:PREDICTED: suppressor APC domain-containing protein 2 isoform X2 [Ceratosolen solmsi marchali]